MSLLHLALKDINEDALQQLVADGACESKNLEFKADLPLVTEEQKLEFLCDVTALANTDGGDIVFGMQADKGVAKELVGLRDFVPDDRTGQLENLLRDLVQPRLMAKQLHVQRLSTGNHVLLIRVGRSLAAPHMVRRGKVTRFCGRNSNGKYDLDLNEIRSAFLAGESMFERLRNFRLDRINKLISQSGPIQLSSPHLMVLHLLPLVSVRPDFRLGTSDFAKLDSHNTPRPMAVSGYSRSYNIDGLLVASSWKDEAFESYLQIYRCGFIEAVDSRLLNIAGNNGIPFLHRDWEEVYLTSLQDYMRTLQLLDINPPYLASISLLGVRGYGMETSVPCYHLRSRADRDNLLSEEVFIENADANPEKVLKPLFDQIWNGFGWQESVNYYPNGDRRRKTR